MKYWGDPSESGVKVELMVDDGRVWIWIRLRLRVYSMELSKKWEIEGSKMIISW